MKGVMESMRSLYNHPAMPKKVRQEVMARALIRKQIELTTTDKEIKKAFSSPRRLKRFVKRQARKAAKMIGG